MSNYIYVYPNQKVVTLHKEPADKDHTYLVLNKEAMFKACKILLPNELKMYLYLASNQDGYTMALSPEDAAQKMGGNADGMRTAVRGLLNKGFLINSHAKEYEFYESPHDTFFIHEKSDSEKSVLCLNESQRVDTGKSSVCNESTKGEIIHRDYMESTDSTNEEFSNIYDWDAFLKKLKITKYPHTLERLVSATGDDELDLDIMISLANDHWDIFENKMGESEGYRLGILTNIVRQKYPKMKQNKYKCVSDILDAMFA